ncbi:hypothetical protein BASA61_003211 [Batrachochytrium salamandrivorans]|nr:hypothetical protein BASA61_003211 [Batrachochytrium salamandrivorans]
MVALVQVLIAVMLIPVSFAAPSARIGYLAPDPPKKDPTRQLKVSTNGRCGKKAGSRCVAEGLISDVDQKTVARNMASVGIRTSIVALAVRNFLVCVIPSRLLYNRFSSTG